MNYFYEIALSQVPHVGPIKAKSLIRYCGSAEAVFTERTSRLKKIPDIGESIARAIGEFKLFDKVEREIEFILKNNYRILYFEEEEFPRRLLHCSDHPIILYTNSTCELNYDRVIGVIGTRKATPYGKKVVEDFLLEMKGSNCLIVSGLAYGIDIAAHREALKNSLPTLGVVAHGLDQIYPRDHASVATQMNNNGGLLTEFLSGTKPDKENFPRRNRIVAGMVDAVLVVESQETGGALITARLANSYNRDVFAVPGKINDPYSLGCNNLIQRNQAAIYTSPKQFLSSMNWDFKVKPRETQVSMPLDLTSEEQKLFNILELNQKVRKDELGSILNVSASNLSATLLTMEIKGLVAAFPGGFYSLVR